MLDCLVIAPHPDDAELGAAGLILKLKQAGRRVGILDLTDGEPTPHGTPELRHAETEAASRQLQIDWRENLGLPNRSLQHTLEARAKVAEAIRRTRPNWLLAPYWVDAHPDHVAATELIEAARFWAKLTKSPLAGDPYHPQRVFHYYCIHLRQNIDPSFVLDISEVWEAKLASITCYQSQFVVGRDGLDPPLLEQFRINAAYWGQRIGRRYGEPYACREPVGLTGLSELC